MKITLSPGRAGCIALALAFLTTAGFSATPDDIITVTPATQYQIIDGFGATVSQFSALYTNLNYYNGGTTAAAKTLFDLLFNSTNGAGLSLARSQIWCLNGETSEPTQGGGFSYATNAILSQVWALQEAQNRYVERYYALPWSAPAWMKANNSCTGDTTYQESYPDAGFVGTTSYLGTLSDPTARDTDFTTYIANYLVAFQQLHQINFGWVGIMNESNTENPLWPTCYFAPASLAEILPKLQTALNNANLGTYRTASETSNIEQPAEAGPPLQTAANSAQAYEQAVFGNSGNYGISYITTHYYGDDHMTGYDTDLNASSYPTHTGLWRLWQSEICKKSDTDTWTEALAWSVQIHQFMKAGWSAWSYWESVSTPDVPDGQSLIGVTSGGVASPTKRLYMMGQFARYIHPGYRLIGCTGDTGSITATAYHNPGNKRIVVVISNSDSSAGHLIQVNGLATGAGVVYDVCTTSPTGNWITNSPSSVTTDVNGDAQVTVPTNGITTLVQELVDTTKPGTITMTASKVGTDALLKWTATGDNGSSGTARNYDLRYRDETAHGTLTTTTFGDANSIQWKGVPPTMEVGTDQKTVIYGPPFISGHKYGFAIESMSWALTPSTMSTLVELTF